MKAVLMLLGSGSLQVNISEDSLAKKYHEKVSNHSYWLENEQMNHCKCWTNDDDFTIWFANDRWCIGDNKGKGTETCSIKAQGSSDQLPTDLDGQWLYWNPDSKEWIQAGNDIIVKFAEDLPYNKDSIE